MNDHDKKRLVAWLGLPESYSDFDPVGREGDCGMLTEKLLSEGYNIHAGVLPSGAVHCQIWRPGEDDTGIYVEAPSRREAIALACLGLCP